MKCHYDVLGVARKATDDELKKAYRKMALQWHPDKNLDRLDEAKAQFQLIQAAYETLSDPHERAFYDRNRESILKGKDTDGHGKPDTLDIFQYFTAQCYSGFNDSEKGFYTVYRQVFEKIASMDMKYMDDQEEEIIIPNFGRSDTDHEDVAQFYGYWMAYCSSMSFHWADEYDIREVHGLGRWAERKVGKDNSKARQKARKQFNEQVRELVVFVRKRDKRWQARKKMLEAKVEENKRKQAAAQERWRSERENKMKDELEKEKANMAAYEKELEMMEEKFAQEWGFEGSDGSDFEEEEAGGGIEVEDDEELDLLQSDNLYCVACNKSFRTEKSMENHEKSKKHKENIESLKAMMTAEDRRLMDSSQNEDSNDNGLPPVEQKSSKKKKKKNRKNNTSLDTTATTQETPSPAPEKPENSTQKRSKNKRNKKNTPKFNVDSEENSDEERDGAIDVAENSTQKRSNKKNRKKNAQKLSLDFENSDSEKEVSKKNRSKKNAQKLSLDLEISDDDDSDSKKDSERLVRDSKEAVDSLRNSEEGVDSLRNSEEGVDSLSEKLVKENSIVENGIPSENSTLQSPSQEENGDGDSADDGDGIKIDGDKINKIEIDRRNNDEDSDDRSQENTDVNVKPKLKGKKAKDARKKAREANQGMETEAKVSHCMVCGKDYPSKTKLFAHIKAEGHAAIKTATKDTKTKERGKGKRK